MGTYPPTECGLATYTQNLRAAIASTGTGARVVRLMDSSENGSTACRYVVASWIRDDPYGMDAVLPVLDACDVAMIQHEFGIYPGRDGDGVIDLVRGCERPVITVLHTVLATPNPHQTAIVESLAAASSRLVVHSQAARTRLLRVHRHLEPSKVNVIPHGAAPNLIGPPALTPVEPMVLTWGLLGPGKGIEHGIEAIALIREQGLDVRYLVAGETHPNVRARDGEQYREHLREFARHRGVADLVDFDGAYRNWASLQAIVRSATIVLLPYDSRDQVTSGVLVEALAAGKPVVATAFPHAVELSRTGAVAVVDHESPEQCARTIKRILNRPALQTMMETAAEIEGSRYDWATVGRQFVAVAEEVEQRFDLAMTI